ncbi:MAG: hypothetical protein KIT62_13445 [Cyclobacteriaceae bacterium]|nr:hypothetical protein [Cyclobacteriaceae bacterium]
MNFRNGKVPVFSFGTCVFALGAVLFIMQWMTQGSRIRADAMITDIEERSWTDSTGAPHFSYHANLKFKTEQGDTLTGYLYTSGRFKFKSGQEVRITYRAGEQQVYPARSKLFYLLFGAITLLGIGIMVVSFKLESEKFDEAT